jgi:hypothetical protein
VPTPDLMCINTYDHLSCNPPSLSQTIYQNPSRTIRWTVLPVVLNRNTANSWSGGQVYPKSNCLVMLLGDICPAHYIKIRFDQCYAFVVRGRPRSLRKKDILLCTKKELQTIYGQTTRSLPQSTRLFRSPPTVLLIYRKVSRLSPRAPKEISLDSTMCCGVKKKNDRAIVHVLLVEEGYIIY